MAAATLLVLALVNPVIQREQRAPRSDVTLLVIDRSQSQTLADRSARTTAAVTALRPRLADMEDLLVRELTVAAPPAALLGHGKRNAHLADDRGDAAEVRACLRSATPLSVAPAASSPWRRRARPGRGGRARDAKLARRGRRVVGTAAAGADGPARRCRGRLWLRQPCHHRRLFGDARAAGVHKRRQKARSFAAINALMRATPEHCNSASRPSQAAG